MAAGTSSRGSEQIRKGAGGAQAGVDRPNGRLQFASSGPVTAQPRDESGRRIPQPVILRDRGGFYEKREPFGSFARVLDLRRAIESRGQRRPKRHAERLGACRRVAAQQEGQGCRGDRLIARQRLQHLPDEPIDGGIIHAAIIMI